MQLLNFNFLYLTFTLLFCTVLYCTVLQAARAEAFRGLSEAKIRSLDNDAKRRGLWNQSAELWEMKRDLETWKDVPYLGDKLSPKQVREESGEWGEGEG